MASGESMSWSIVSVLAGVALNSRALCCSFLAIHRMHNGIMRANYLLQMQKRVMHSSYGTQLRN